jgi:predicted RNA-binding protein YlqC (UPF0109 family)
VRDLVQFIAENLVEHTDEIEVREGDREGLYVVLLAPDDVGRVIGRRGRTAKAIRTVLRAAGRYDLDIVDSEEQDAG